MSTPTRQGQPARKMAVTEIYWGYGSGLVVTHLPDWGDFVLAELTLTFDRTDIVYFLPLMAAAERRLGFRPQFGALDAAYDTHYVYDYFDQAGGFAAVPFSRRGGPTPKQFDPEGHPLCAAGLAMAFKNRFRNRRGLVPHHQIRYGCPLLLPQPTGQSCPIAHKKWSKGGCLTTLVDSPGARIRHQLDRDSPAYKQVYNQRSAVERINARAVHLGIERPKLRNRRSITNQNTLIYILLNLQALHRVRARNHRLAQATHSTTAS